MALDIRGNICEKFHETSKCGSETHHLVGYFLSTTPDVYRAIQRKDEVFHRRSEETKVSNPIVSRFLEYIV